MKAELTSKDVAHYMLQAKTVGKGFPTARWKAYQ